MAIKEIQMIKYNGKTIPAEELSHGSSKEIVCICDCCGKEVIKIAKVYYKCLEKHHGKYYCKECFNNDKELLSEKAENAKQTCLEKYGVTNPMKVDEFKARVKQTLVEHWGVENPGQIEEGIIKRKNTCMELYGSPVPPNFHTDNCHSPEARQKAMATSRERYGGVGFELEENRVKASETRANSGKVRTSSQQIAIFNMIRELYPEAITCELNEPLSELSLDVELILDNVKIDIEADGKYWHQNAQKDRARDEIVKANGYKVLRIKFDHMIPTKEELKESLDKLINSEHKYYELILSDY